MRALKTRRITGSALLSAVIVCARFFPLAPLRDAATGEPVAGPRLVFSCAHLLLTPFSGLADVASCQSARQDLAFLLLLLLLGAGWLRFFVVEEDLSRWFSPLRGLRVLGLWTALVAAWAAWTIAGPRPMARLALPDGDALAVDFHSHTSGSWDARRSFSPARSAAWHTAAGYGAFFITDHNAFEAAREAHAQSLLARREGAEPQAQALLGEELSLSGAHVVVLGNRDRIDPQPFADGLQGLERFLGSHAGALAVMSLPEYSRYHWRELDALAAAGADGFELVAGSPKGLEFPASRRQRVVSLCESRGLFMTGISDNHGWGGPPCVWSVLRVPGWTALDADALQAAVLSRLRAGGASAAQVLVRSFRVEPSPGAAVWLDPARELWRLARSWSWAQALCALAWTWVFPMAFSKFRL